MIKWILAVLGIVTLIAFQNCSKSNFEQITDSPSNKIIDDEEELRSDGLGYCELKVPQPIALLEEGSSQRCQGQKIYIGLGPVTETDFKMAFRLNPPLNCGPGVATGTIKQEPRENSIGNSLIVVAGRSPNRACMTATACARINTYLNQPMTRNFCGWADFQHTITRGIVLGHHAWPVGTDSELGIYFDRPPNPENVAVFEESDCANPLAASEIESQFTVLSETRETNLCATPGELHR